MYEAAVRRTIGATCVVAAIVIAVFATGCTKAYWRNRLNDAADMLEPGITISGKPGFMIFTDCLSLLPLGYSNVEGTKIGFGNRQFGMLYYEHKSWGAFLLCGEYEQGVGRFNPEDPHQARADQKDAATWPTYEMGIVSLLINGNPKPLPAALECDKSIHLGWIGVSIKYRYADMIDFVLGFTTLDILGDDLVKEEPAPAPPQEPEAKPASLEKDEATSASLQNQEAKPAPLEQDEATSATLQKQETRPAPSVRDETAPAPQQEEPPKQP